MTARPIVATFGTVQTPRQWLVVLLEGNVQDKSKVEEQLPSTAQGMAHSSGLERGVRGAGLQKNKVISEE